MSKHENKKQSALRELLNEPGIAKARPIHQPADGALLTLEITQVLPYDRNPRKGKNPKYDEIKAAILAQGIMQTKNVTQRPGMPPNQFMIWGGGNTCLEILNELHEKTGDPRWLSCQFIYKAWKDDSSNVIEHMIENTARGGMTLIDKAHGVFDAQKLLEEETGNTYSNRKLVDILKSRGLTSVPLSHITIYEFAVKILYPVIPDLLNRGLGHLQINHINKLLNAAEQLGNHYDPDDDQLHSLLLQCLEKQNYAEINDDWQEQFQDDVVRELARGDRDDFEKIRFQLNHLIKHGKLLLPDEAATGSPIPPITKSVKKKSTVEEPAPDSDKQPTQETTLKPPQENNLPDTESINTDNPIAGEQAAYLANDAAESLLEEDPLTINALQTSISDMAHDMAEIMFAKSDDADCVVSIENGAGFFIREFPSLANTDKEPIYTDIEISPSQHNEHLCIRTANCIDFLLNIAEQFSSTATAVIEALNLYPENSLLATYHNTVIYELQPDEGEPPTLKTWRNIFDRRRHNSLSFSYYNLTQEESERVAALMNSLLDAYHQMTAAQYHHTGTLPLWMMEEQS